VCLPKLQALFMAGCYKVSWRAFPIGHFVNLFHRIVTTHLWHLGRLIEAVPIPMISQDPHPVFRFECRDLGRRCKS
jgi:hypothetical protein